MILGGAMKLKPGQWAETEHQCRYCMAGRVMRGKELHEVFWLGSRLVKRVTSGSGVTTQVLDPGTAPVGAEEVTVFKCFSCGAQGGTHQAVCGCGAKFPNGRLRGFRCSPNPAPSPAIPWLYGFEEMVGFEDPSS